MVGQAYFFAMLSGLRMLAGLSTAPLRLAKKYAWPTNLTAATLTRASLVGANLRSANLTKADLTGADLFHTDLTDATLNSAKLDASITHMASAGAAVVEGKVMVG